MSLDLRALAELYTKPGSNKIDATWRLAQGVLRLLSENEAREVELRMLRGANTVLNERLACLPVGMEAALTQAYKDRDVEAQTAEDWKEESRLADKRVEAAKRRAEKAEAALGEMRPEVRAFALAMEERLQANAWKNGTWKDCRPGWLIVRLYEEVEELDQARARRDGPAVRREAADVANFAMTVADLCGGLILEGREEKP